MKGISAILATVLIVVITVAIIGMAYGWATGLFKLTSGAAEEGVSGVTDKMAKSIDITAASCDDDGYIEFTIKNTGTKEISATELSVFVDGAVPTGVTFANLPAGESDTYTTTSTYTGEPTLKVDAPAAPVEETVTCPAAP